MPKIAFPTDDGETISAHLGRARVFAVASYEDEGEVAFDERQKPQHGPRPQSATSGDIELHDHAHEPGQHAHGGPGGMLASIADCDVLIAGGMGEPAYEAAQRLGLEVVLTGQKRIHEALAAYRAGTLVTDLRRVHSH